LTGSGSQASFETGNAGTTILSVAPNPFDAAVTVVFNTAQPGEASLAVYDMAGREVRTISIGELTEGQNLVTWDGRTETGEKLPPGVYLAIIRQYGFGSNAERIVLLP